MNSNKDLCIEMWTIIAEDDCSKIEALQSMRYKWLNMPDSHCFACEEVSGDCNNCPVTWAVNEPDGCCSKDSPYNKWDDSTSSKERMKYAAEVLYLIKTTWEE